MNTEMTEKNETSRAKISITILWKALKKFWAVVLISAVLVALFAGVYRYTTRNNTYTVSYEFSIVNIDPSGKVIQSGTQSAAATLATTCVDLINKDYYELIDEAADEIAADDMLAASLGLYDPESDGVKDLAKIKENAKSYLRSVSAGKSNKDSEFFTISATNLDKEKAHAVIVAVKRVLPDVMKKYFKAEGTSITTTVVGVGDFADNFSEAVTGGYIRTNGKGEKKFAVVGGAVAAVVSYMICLFVFINDTKVHDEATIKENFASPIIGVIPEWNVPGVQNTTKDKKKKRGRSSIVRNYKGKLLTAKTPFAVSEAFKTLRTNLCYSTAAEKCPVFAITSDFSGAGKSVISANVAISLAMLGKKTLLVECDLRRPELAEVFEIEKKAGLSELLSGVITDSSDALANVNIENLDVVLSGRIPPNPSELLGSENMQEFIRRSKENYDIIIIDTPPAFEVSDVGVIVPMLSGVVMVARSNYSDVKAIRDSEELITGVNGKIVGYVVNDVDIKAGSAYHSKKYGYRRYYKYARYYSHYGNTAEENSAQENK